VNPTGLYQIFTFKQQRRSFWFNHILPPPLPPQGHTIFPLLRFCIQCFLSALHKFFVITLTAAVETNFILANGGLRPIWHATLSVLLSSTQRLHQVPLESFVKVGTANEGAQNMQVPPQTLTLVRRCSAKPLIHSTLVNFLSQMIMRYLLPQRQCHMNTHSLDMIMLRAL